MKKITAMKATTASVLLAFAATGAAAGDWQGFYAGASIVAGQTYVDGIYDSSDDDGPFRLNPLETQGFGGEVFGGYLFHGSTRFAFGPEVSYSHIDLGESYLNTEPPTNGPDLWTLSGNSMWHARLRGGIVNNNQFYYAAVGYAHLDYTARVFNARFSETETVGSGFGAGSIGVGMEMQVNQNMRLRAEVNHIFINETVDIEFTGDGDPGDTFEFDGVTLVNIGAVWAF